MLTESAERPRRWKGAALEPSIAVGTSYRVLYKRKKINNTAQVSKSDGSESRDADNEWLDHSIRVYHNKIKTKLKC